jgi:hypothetical protein
MESESPSAGPVNWFDSEIEGKSLRDSFTEPRQKPRLSSLEIYDRRTFRNFLRIKGWIDGVWEKSHQTAKFYDWDAAAFSRATGRGGKKIEVRTLERIFPRFQLWCQEYYFNRENIGGRWTVRITRDDRVRNIGGNQVHDRVIARIRRHVALAGRIKVDLEWCRKFSEISRLSLNSVETVWLRIRKIDGLKHKWRGSGRGRKLCVEATDRWDKICTDRAAEKIRRKNEKFDSSHPQTSLPVSISCGNDKIQSSGPGDRSPEESVRALPAKELVRGRNNRVGEGMDAEPGGFEPSGIEPYFGRWFPGRKPWQICGRLVLPQNVQRMAAWVAVARLKFVHDRYERVAFAFPHARNFALAALRFGYRVPAIEKAWELGVAKSHADAVDAGESRDDPPRPPSAAQTYAFYFLRGADPRSAEELWSEFFAAPRQYVKPADRDDIADDKPKHAKSAKQRALREVGRGESGARFSAAEAAVKMAELRAKIYRGRDSSNARPPGEVTPEKFTGLTIAELKKACDRLGLSIAAFNALPWARKKEIVDRALNSRQP